jgi:hypothetical protein
MRLRFYANVTVAALGAVLLTMTPLQLAGQAQKTPAKTSKSTPDLQGYWSNATVTPLERPAELAHKEFYTEAEALAYEKARIERENAQAKDDIHYDNVLWQTEAWGKGVSNRRTSLIFDPPDGRVPPLTPLGQKLAAVQADAARRRNAAASAQDRSLAERCITWGAKGPPMLGSTYNANLQIVQTPSLVTIYSEIDGIRFVPLDGRPHLPANIRQLAGNSIGRWDGDTLVVDTTNFTDRTNFRPPPSTGRQDIFSSEGLHVIERFTRTDADTMLYRFTVEDPVWTRPWSGEIVMRKTTGPIYEYACHEGNYGLANILAGARAAENAAK